MNQPAKLSHRFINALQQLPQFACEIGSLSDNAGKKTLTHALTGVRVRADLDLLNNADDVSDLQVTFNEGHFIVVHAHLYFELALKEAVEIELATDVFSPPTNNSSHAFKSRYLDLKEHLYRKHALDGNH